MSKGTIEKHGHVLHIGIKRPEKRNACDLEVLAGLAEGYERLSVEGDLRTGVLFGHGSHFTAGLDLGDVDPAARAGGPGAMFGGAPHDPFGFWGESTSKPVVVAVQGIAFTIAIAFRVTSSLLPRTFGSTSWRLREVFRPSVVQRSAPRNSWGGARHALLVDG